MPSGDTVDSLKFQRLSHNDDYKEICSGCGKAFKSKITLSYHMKKENCREDVNQKELNDNEGASHSPQTSPKKGLCQKSNISPPRTQLKVDKSVNDFSNEENGEHEVTTKTREMDIRETENALLKYTFDSSYRRKGANIQQETVHSNSTLHENLYTDSQNKAVSKSPNKSQICKYKPEEQPLKYATHNTANKIGSNLHPNSSINYCSTLKCSICNFETKIQSCFTKHMTNHSENNLLKCNDCVYETNSQNLLNEHVIQHIKIRTDLFCSPESSLGMNKNSVNQHMSSHSERKMFTCSQCSYESDDKHIFKDHELTHSTSEKSTMTNHLESKLLKCNACVYETNSQKNFNKHVVHHRKNETYLAKSPESNLGMNKNSVNQLMLSHSERKVFTCTQCSYESDDKYVFKDHQLTHTSEKRYTCNECEFKTNRTNYFKRHMQSHSKLKRKLIICSKCTFKTNTKTLLKKHISNRHNPRKTVTFINISPNSKIFHCEVCNLKTTNKSSLKRHLLTHNKTEKLQCSKCSYETYHKDYMKAHYKRYCKGYMGKRSKETIFNCNECDYKTTTKGCYLEHAMHHKTEFLFHCSECDFKCNSKQRFKHHVLDDSTNKSFHCSKCNVESKFKCILNQHMLSHPKEKLFRCTFCTFETDFPANLQKHIMRQCQKTVFKCSKCSFVTDLKFVLGKHLIHHHKSSGVNDSQDSNSVRPTNQNHEEGEIVTRNIEMNTAKDTIESTYEQNKRKPLLKKAISKTYYSLDSNSVSPTDQNHEEEEIVTRNIEMNTAKDTIESIYEQNKSKPLLKKTISKTYYSLDSNPVSPTDQNHEEEEIVSRNIEMNTAKDTIESIYEQNKSKPLLKKAISKTYYSLDSNSVSPTDQNHEEEEIVTRNIEMNTAKDTIESIYEQNKSKPLLKKAISKTYYSLDSNPVSPTDQNHEEGEIVTRNIEMNTAKDTIESTYEQNKRKPLLKKAISNTYLFNCSECNLKTNNKELVNDHILKDSTGFFRCSKCLFKTLFKCTFNKHLLSHSYNETHWSNCNSEMSCQTPSQADNSNTAMRTQDSSNIVMETHEYFNNDKKTAILHATEPFNENVPDVTYFKKELIILDNAGMLDIGYITGNSETANDCEARVDPLSDSQSAIYEDNNSQLGNAYNTITDTINSDVSSDSDSKSEIQLNVLINDHDKILLTSSLSDYETKNQTENITNFSEIKLLKCSQCAHETDCPKLLKQHMKLHKKNNSSNTRLGSNHSHRSDCKATSKFDELTPSTTDKTRRFSCDHCQFKSSRKYDLKRHMLTHSKKKTLKCSECAFETHKKVLLKQHMKHHRENDSLNSRISSKHSHRSNCKVTSKFDEIIDSTTDKTRRFSCDHCQYNSSQKRDLKRHILSTHFKTKMLKSSECTFETNKKVLLKQHMEDHKEHDSSNTRLRPKHSHRSDCKAISKFDELSHSTTEEVKRFSCDQCQYKSNQKLDLKWHMLTHFKTKMLKFSECQFETNKKALLKQHIEHHKEYDSSNSMISSKHSDRSDCKTTSKLDELTHSTTEETKRFSCDHCRYKSSRKYDLKRHMLTHFKTKLLKCSECEFVTDKKSLLRIHISKFHKHYKTRLKSHESSQFKLNVKKKFQCTHCDYEANLKTDMNRHILTHNKTNELQCSKCSYKTYRKDYLETHYKKRCKGETVKNRTKKPLFKCDECEFETPTEDFYLEHTMHHEAESLFHCSECDFECNSKRRYKRHRLDDSTAESFRCSECSFETKLKCILNTHRLSHSKGKLFRCALCNFETDYAANYRRHTLRQCQKKVFKCSQCSYVTNVKFLLGKHLVYHHKNSDIASTS